MKSHIKICRYKTKCRYKEKCEYKHIENMQPKDVTEHVDELERKIKELIKYQKKAEAKVVKWCSKQGKGLSPTGLPHIVIKTYPL